LEGLGDGLVYETIDGTKDTDWPPYEFCSKSSCSSDVDDDGDGGTFLTVSNEHCKSDSELRIRPRKDSEGYLLPNNLPWHQIQSDPTLNHRHHHT
jgi:hypothetical protein